MKRILAALDEWFSEGVFTLVANVMISVGVLIAVGIVIVDWWKRQLATGSPSSPT
jgi:hypothetical protein